MCHLLENKLYKTLREWSLVTGRRGGGGGLWNGHGGGGGLPGPSP